MKTKLFEFFRKKKDKVSFKSKERKFFWGNIWESIQRIVARFLWFLVHNNPLFLYFWVRSFFLFSFLFSKRKECFSFGIFWRNINNKAKGDTKSFNQKHPLFSAGVSFFLILAIIFNSCWLVFFRKTQPAAAWWNDLWMYRKTIVVSNSSGSELTDFQVKILDNKDLSADISAGKIQSDLDDLRFTDINGNLLPYWIEDATTTSVDVWVKMPRIPTSGATVYMYYGNSSVSSAADGNQVFEFFDDFSGDNLDLNKWSVLTGQSVPAISGGNLALGSNETWIYAKGKDWNQYVFQSKFRVPVLSHPGFIYNQYQEGYAYDAYWEHGWNYLQRSRHYGINKYGDRVGVGTGSLGNSITAGNWYVSKISVNGTNGVFLIDGVGSWNITMDANYSHGTVGFLHYDSGAGNMDVDWIFVRKYASADPSVGAPSTEEKTQGPVAYWSFDEGAGTVVNDETNNNNDGTISGAIWKTESDCVSGECLWFDGNDDRVIVNNANVLNSNSALSVSLWVRPKSFPTSSNPRLLHKYIDANNDFSIGSNGVNAQGVWAQFKVGGINYAVGGTSAQTLVVGRWTHIVVTFNSGVLKIYLDGVDKTNGSGIGAGVYTSSSNLFIGCRGADSYFPGYIDEPKIYNYAWTADQIKADYNAGIAGMGKAKEGVKAAMGDKSDKWMTDGLVGYWKMDEASWNGTANEVVDSSGNGLHGTRVSNATTASGKFGNGGSFAGGTDAVTLNATYTFGNGDWTALAWIKTSTDGKVMGPNSGGPAANSFDIVNGKITYRNYDGSWQSHSGAISVIDNNWHLLVWVNHTGQTMNMFVDGIYDIGGFNSYTTNGGPINSIGRNWESSFNGKLDEVRIYNRALSPDEIRKLYEWAPGPVGHWKLDDGSGTTAVDSSGNGNNGTLMNGADWAQGKYGGGVNLIKEHDQYINISNENNFDFSSAVTIESWVNLSSNENWAGIVSKTLSNTNGWEIRNTSSQGGIQCRILNGVDAGPATTISLEKWHHLACSYSVSDNIVRLYVDGILSAFNSGSNGIAINDSSLKLGGLGYASGLNFSGQIDDVRIYNYARTQKQIIEDMNAGHPAGGSPVGSQVGYWKFDEGYGTTAYGSVNGYNLTNYNGPVWSMDGKFGKALDFDGINDMAVSTGVSGPFEYRGEDMTFSVWVNVDSAETVGNIFCKPWNGNGDYNYCLGVNASKQIGFSMKGATTWSTTTTESLTAGKWSNIIVSLESSTKAVKIYKDGVLIKSGNHNISNWSPPNGDFNIPLCIGSLYPYGEGWSGDAGFSFDGQIDEVKIYPYALTEEEVKLDYNQGKSLVMGSKGTESDGKTPSQSASREYCVPGDTVTCNPPIAEWKFDEMTGTTANDTSGNNRHLSFSNNPSWYATGKIGSALDFDNDDYVSYDWTDFSLINQTIEFWFKADTINSSYRDLVGTTLNTDSNRFHLDAGDNSIKWWYYVGASSSLDSNVIPVVGQWYHVAGTYDGSTVKIYVNGQLKNSTNASIASYTATGAFIGGTTEDFDGQIDDVKIYNYARTPAQIAWDYNRGKPVGWWKMDEGEGTTVYDHSGNSNNGTMTNMDPVTDWVTGKNNKALDFDGVNDYVIVNSPNYKFQGGDFSVSLWAKPSILDSSYDGLVTTDSTSDEAWKIIRDSGNNYFRARYGTTIINYPNVAIGEWHHYTMAKSGTNLTVYFDGRNSGSSTCPSSYTGGSDKLVLGSYRVNDAQNGFHMFSGQIDDVRIYNYALTADQVKQIYNEGALSFK